MVQKTFVIYNHSIPGDTLHIEVGRQYFACWSGLSEGNAISSFELFLHDAGSQTSFSEVVAELQRESALFSQPFGTIQIIWQQEQCTIIPKPFFREDLSEAFTQMIFGNEMGVQCQSELVADKVFLFDIPQDWAQTMLHHFPAASFHHKYSRLFSNWSEGRDRAPETFLHAMFYQQHFILVVVKQQNIHLLNSFSYSTPEDALYHLLNVCERLGIDKNVTPVFVSGLIDPESGLYKQLHQYISDLRTRDFPTAQLAAEGFREYPSHFFSSFCNAVV